MKLIFKWFEQLDDECKPPLIAFITLFVIVVCFIHVSTFHPLVNNMLVDVPQGGTTQTFIKVNFGFLCQSDVSLSTESNLSYIHINFNPVILRHGSDAVSTLIISVDRNAPLGDYLIPIIIEPNDSNYTEEVKLKLIVTQDQTSASTVAETSTVTEKPTLAETTTVAETPASTSDTTSSTRTPDTNSIITFIGVVSSFATICAACIAYKDYRLRKNR